jgi:hypothetical protein
MQRSTSPTQMSPDSSSVHYTRTGRISKAKKGLKVHNCDCGRVSSVFHYSVATRLGLFNTICHYAAFPRSPIVYNAPPARVRSTSNPSLLLTMNPADIFPSHTPELNTSGTLRLFSYDQPS